MRLAVLGATGRTGIPLVQQALAKGHTLKVLARNASKLQLSKDQSANVTVITGSSLDADKVDETINGTDMVLCVLGHASGSPSDILEKSTANILKSMKTHNVKKIIVLSMESVPDKDDKAVSGYQKFSSFVTKLSISDLWHDSVNQAKLILEEPRDEIEYVIIRGPRLTEDKWTGKYKTANQFSYGMYITCTISRADVADFMLKLVEDKNLYLNQCPCIMY
jgi:nucleoside-diphosphate-sugar epimerase